MRTDLAMTALPCLNGMINVSERAGVTYGPFRSLPDRKTFAVETADTNLSSNYLDTVRLSISWGGNILRCGCKRLDAVPSHKTMKWGEDVIIFRKRQ
jgi:hypothetical protein